MEAVQSFPPHNRGSALGVYTAFVDLSLGISGPMAGVIVSELGYSPIFLFAAVLAGLGLTLSFLIYRKHSRDPAIGEGIRESPLPGKTPLLALSQFLAGSSKQEAISNRKPHQNETTQTAMKESASSISTLSVRA